MKSGMFAAAITQAAVFFLSVVSPSLARADLTPITPFTGTYSETFESFQPLDVVGTLPNPTPVFGGQATMTIFPAGSTSPGSGIAIYNVNPPYNDTFGSFLPSDGSQFAVTQDFGDIVSITFNTPPYQFGGYFGEATNTGVLAASMTFLDSNGAIVASENFTPGGSYVGPGLLTWTGFQTSSAFSTVEITPDPNALLDVSDRTRRGGQSIFALRPPEKV